MTAILTAWGIGFIAMLIMMTTLWGVSLALKDSSIVDIFWGVGFILMAWTYYFTVEGAAPRQLLIVILVTVWGLRLASYIIYRNWGKGEDFRYQSMREDRGESWWWVSFFQVFLLQGILFWVISLPLLAAQAADTPAALTLVDYIGIAVWGIGFFFETVGDLQLAVFKSKPENEGELLTSGLWRYTRHPNYFGDAAVWWGYGIIALATMTAFGVISLIGPAIMTYLLLRVSGVAMLEKSLKDTKPGYEEYVRKTSGFFPLPPKDS
jgi:steroid 5-alpha reductase family enzyme